MKPNLTKLVKEYIWKHGYQESGYYKEVDFKNPVPITVFHKPHYDEPGIYLPCFATGMLVESDVGGCGHECHEPFVIYDVIEGEGLGISCEMGDVDEKYHDALLDAMLGLED